MADGFGCGPRWDCPTWLASADMLVGWLLDGRAATRGMCVIRHVARVAPLTTVVLSLVTVPLALKGKRPSALCRTGTNPPCPVYERGDTFLTLLRAWVKA